jgi:hypothetical protein
MQSAHSWDEPDAPALAPCLRADGVHFLGGVQDFHRLEPSASLEILKFQFLQR